MKPKPSSKRKTTKAKQPKQAVPSKTPAKPPRLRDLYSKHCDATLDFLPKLSAHAGDSDELKAAFDAWKARTDKQRDEIYLRAARVGGELMEESWFAMADMVNAVKLASRSWGHRIGSKEYHEDGRADVNHFAALRQVEATREVLHRLLLAAKAGGTPDPRLLPPALRATLEAIKRGPRTAPQLAAQLKRPNVTEWTVRKHISRLNERNYDIRNTPGLGYVYYPPKEN